MASLSWPAKDPDEVLDYALDWSNVLETGETISTSTWTVPSGITDSSASISGSTTRIWLSSGTSGTVYSVTNKIVTSDGRTWERTARLPVVSTSS